MALVHVLVQQHLAGIQNAGRNVTYRQRMRLVERKGQPNIGFPEAVERLDAARRMPVALWEPLAAVSSAGLENLPGDDVERLNGRLASAVGDPVARARQLLAWAGSLTWPAEALSGEGAVAMTLLGRIDRSAVLDAMDRTTDPNVVMAGVCRACTTGTENGVAARLADAISALLRV